MNYWLLLIPLLSAFTGWIIIRAIRILIFRPIQPVKIFGTTWQGMLPRHQQGIAEQVGRFAAAELTSFAGLEQKIYDPKNFESIRPLIEAHMDDFLRNKLKEQMPMVGMFIGDKTIQSLKTIFIQEIEELFPRVMQQFAGNLQKEVDIESIIVSKITTLPAGKLEALFSKNLETAFQKVSLLAIAIGLLTGIIQLLLLVSIIS